MSMFLKTFLTKRPAYPTHGITHWNQIQLQLIYNGQASEFYQKDGSFNFQSSKEQLLTLLNFIENKTQGRYPIFILFQKKVEQLTNENSQIDQEAYLHWAKKTLEEHFWFICHIDLKQPSILDRYTVDQCGVGAASNLDMALRHFSMTNFDVALHTAKENLLRTLVQSYVQENNLYLGSSSEVHVINAYFNYLADNYGCHSQTDALAVIYPRVIHLERITNYVEKNFTLSNFLDVLHTLLPALPNEAFDASNQMLFGSILEYAHFVEPNNEILANSFYQSLYDYEESYNELENAFTIVMQPKTTFTTVLNGMLVSKLCREKVIDEKSVSLSLGNIRCIFNGQIFLAEKNENNKLFYTALTMEEMKALQEKITVHLLNRQSKEIFISKNILFGVLEDFHFIRLYKNSYLDNPLLADQYFTWIIAHPSMINMFFEQVVKNKHYQNPAHLCRFAEYALGNPTSLPKKALEDLLYYLKNHQHELIKNCVLEACKNNAYQPLQILVCNDQSASRILDHCGWGLANQAIQDGNLEVLRVILSHGFDTFKSWVESSLAIANAVRQKQTAIIKLLCAVGCDIEQQDIQGNTALWIAACNDDVESIVFLINAGSTAIDQGNFSGTTPLMIAVQNGHIRTVRALLSAGATINQRDGSRKTACWIAAHCGHVDILKALWHSGANVNQADIFGVTPLLAATYRNQLPTVSFLLTHGANISQTDHKGRAPLWAAAYNGEVALLMGLLNAGAFINQTDNKRKSPLWIATKKRNLEAVKTLLKHNADCNIGDVKKGRTPLWIAAATGKVKFLEVLLNAGAATHHAAQGRVTALSIAVRKGYNDILKLLIDKGANLYQTDCNGASPLWIAAHEGHVETLKLLLNTIVADRSRAHIVLIVRALLKQGFQTALNELLNPNPFDTTNEDGLTPLSAAIIKNRTQAIQTLLGYPVDINRLDDDGNTALNLATQQGQLENVKRLIEAGADINQQNKWGKTPLWHAAKKGDVALLSLLLHNGANKYYADTLGVLPLEIATFHQHSDIIQLLTEKNNPIRTYSFFNKDTSLKKNETTAKKNLAHNLQMH